MKLYAILFWVLVGFAGGRFVDDTVIPTIEYGYNQVDDVRVEECRRRSLKWYRKLHSRGFYHRCVAGEA